MRVGNWVGLIRLFSITGEIIPSYNLINREGARHRYRYGIITAKATHRLGLLTKVDPLVLKWLLLQRLPGLPLDHLL